jgi:hypothetical protein
MPLLLNKPTKVVYATKEGIGLVKIGRDKTQKNFEFGYG